MTAASSDRRVTPGRVLVVLGIVMLVGPALFPMQPVLYHDTGAEARGNASEIERSGVEIVAYENLSARGQELYVSTLRAGGEYSVPVGAGASDFTYPSPEELRDVDDYRERQSMTRVAVERPPDADLPPADEPVRFAEERLRDERQRQGGHDDQSTATDGNESGPTAEELREQIARYDVMTTRTDGPPLTAAQSLARLLSAALGILAIGVGGYLSSRPRAGQPAASKAQHAE